jgi:hypothetical protein
MLSINVDVLDVLFISCIDKSPTQSLWCVEIQSHCEYHDMKYSLFCQHHDKPCCPDCISTHHKDCVGLLSIREIIKK